jgi:hypothetical protein
MQALRKWFIIIFTFHQKENAELRSSQKGATFKQ